MRKSLQYVVSAALLLALVCCLAIFCVTEPDGVTSSNPEVGDLIRQLYSDLGRQHVLNVIIDPKDGGNVLRVPDTKSTTYKDGTEVTLTAVPAKDFKFAGWSGAFNGTAETVKVTMNEELTLKATFVSTRVAQYSLIVNPDPGQGGVVSRSPNKSVYNDGDTVTVTAKANKDYKFTGWSGALSETSSSVVVVMTSNMTLNANFIEEHLNAYALRIKVEPSGAGTVTRKPDRGIYYAGGSWVDVTAVPESGYVFDSWSGAATGSANPLRIQMNGDKTLTAVFRAR